MADKYLKHDTAGGLAEQEAAAVGGGGSANQIPALDGSGRLDATMMPTGIGAETSLVPASGSLAAGDFVNVYNDAGTMRARKADASSAVAPANGFVLDAFADLATATVYWGGLNTAVTGLTPGVAYMSTTPGIATATAPSTSGNVVQKIGWAVNATTVMFSPREHILLA